MVQQSTNNIFENVYKFNGKELDEQTGYYYYGARYYDPGASIFLSVDPLAEDFPGWNPYHYVHNNPINLIDPTGMSAQEPGGGNPDKKAQHNFSFSVIQKDIKDNYSKSGMKDIGDFFSSLIGSSKITDENGAVDFYSKDGGGEGQKTTGTVEERRDGSALLTLASFAGAPIKSFRSGKPTTYVFGGVKKAAENFKEGMDAAQSFIKADNATNKTSTQVPDSTSWDLQYWKGGEPHGGRSQPNTGYKRASQQAIQDRKDDPTLDSIQVLRR